MRGGGGQTKRRWAPAGEATAAAGLGEKRRRPACSCFSGGQPIDPPAPPSPPTHAPTTTTPPTPHHPPVLEQVVVHAGAGHLLVDLDRLRVALQLRGVLGHLHTRTHAAGSGGGGGPVPVRQRVPQQRGGHGGWRGALGLGWRRRVQRSAAQGRRGGGQGGRGAEAAAAAVPTRPQGGAHRCVAAATSQPTTYPYSPPAPPPPPPPCGGPCWPLRCCSPWQTGRRPARRT